MRIAFGVKSVALALIAIVACGAPVEAKGKVFSSIEEIIKHDDTKRKLELLPPNVDPFDIRCQDEVTWLACAIYFEARGEKLEGQRKVALSVLARVYDRRWPNTIEKVVRQGEGRRHRCQYSFRCDGIADRIRDENAWTNALFVAQITLGNKQVGCAHSYHADYVVSKTALVYFTTLTPHEKVGAHIFYCDKPHRK